MLQSASSFRALPSRLSLLAHSTTTNSRRTFATTLSRNTVYGFIGLGHMGYPMAANLRAKLPESDSLLVNDRNVEALEKFQSEINVAANAAGKPTVDAYNSAREVAEKSDVLITCLPEPKSVTSAYGNIIPRALPPTPGGEERLFIDCSTIDPQTSRTIAEAIHSTRSGRFVDAPMSGGVVGAKAGSLTFMVGASTRTGGLVDRVKPILGLMGARVMHLGAQGAGLAGKLANNYLLAVSNIATAEAMTLGTKLGLDPKVLSELINTCSGQCWSSTVNNPVPGVVKGAPAEKDYEGGFGIGLMAKDLSLAITAAKNSETKLELANETARIYQTVNVAEPGKDFSVVYKWLNRDSNGNGNGIGKRL